MAKYHRQKNLTVCGLQPGSRIFIATVDDHGDIDKHVCNQLVDNEEVSVLVPEGELLFRMRGKRLRTFDTKLSIGAEQQVVTVINVKD